MAPDSPARRRPLVLAALALGLISVAIGLSAGPASGQGSTLPYENASLPINQRVNDLLGRMTLAEKVGQMFVSYVYGDSLRQANGRCLSYPGELEKLRAKHDEFDRYVVEVCVDCRWNHLGARELHGRRHAV